MYKTAACFLAGIAVVSVLFAVTGCQNRPLAPPEEPALLLRTYQVPAGFEDEARATLRRAMALGDKMHGEVSIGPSGALVVVAPPAIQAGVAAFIEQLNQSRPESRRPQSVTLDYWILVGRRGGSGRAVAGVPRREGAGFTVLGTDGLSRLDAALGGIAGSQGPIEFTLLEHLRIASIGDEGGRSTGRRSEIQQRAALSGDDVVAEIRVGLERTSHQLSTRVVLKRGQLLVLAESGYDGEVPAAFAGAGGDDLTLYYVVAADLPA